MIKTTRRRRRPQFRRSKPAPMQPTDDDLTICRHLGKYIFADFTDLRLALPHRSIPKLRARMRTLYDNRYVDRPIAQRDVHAPGTRPEIIYALGDRGAAFLAEVDGWQAPRSNWTDKNRSVGRPHLLHTLAVSSIRTAVDRLPDLVSHLSIITADDILARAPETTRRDAKPWAWHAQLPQTGGSHRIATTMPDHVFGLDFLDVRARYYFFCEADRSTMPVVRSNPRQSSIYKKFEAYLAGYQANYHHQRYGIGNLRFLFVTTTQRRVDNMIAALADLADGRDTSMFLFTDTRSLTAVPNLLTLSWRDGRDRPVTLPGPTPKGVSHAHP